MLLFFIRNEEDTIRLSQDEKLEPAHGCKPRYFDDEKTAYFHPLATGMVVDAVPAAETIPGAPLGTDIADAVMADEVYQAIG